LADSQQSKEVVLGYRTKYGLKEFPTDSGFVQVPDYAETWLQPLAPWPPTAISAESGNK
jgi:hypothetical protein